MSLATPRGQTPDRNRRRLLGALAAAALGTAQELLAAAPPAGRRRIVNLIPGSRERWRKAAESLGRSPFEDQLSAALAPLGWSEGKNLVCVVKYTPSQREDFDPLLADIRGDRFDAAVVYAGHAAMWRELLPGLSMIAWNSVEPVGEGLAESLTRPGGRITGTHSGTQEVAQKSIQILKLLAPQLSGIAVVNYLAAPQGLRKFEQELFEAAVRGSGLRVVGIPGDRGNDALSALKDLRRQGVQAAYYHSPPLPLGCAATRSHADEAGRHRIALFGAFENLADCGFLFSYGEKESEFILRVALQVDRILRGADPARMPFIGPARYDLKVNRRTAKTLALAIPPEVQLMGEFVD